MEALDLFVTDGMSSLVQNSLVLAGTIVVLFILDWRLALATLIVLPLMGLATAWFRSRSNRAYKSVRERLGLVTATLAEDISGMRVVQSFTREPASQTTFRGVNERYREANFDTVVLNWIYFPTVDILSSVATAIVLGVGGWLVVEGNMTIGTLLAFTLYLGNFFDPVQQLSQLYNTFLSATAALDRITNVLDEEPDTVDGPDARPLERVDGHVRFEHVRFGYGDLPDGSTTSTSTFPQAPRSRSSATPAPGSRRSQSSSPASTTRATAASPSTRTDLHRRAVCRAGDQHPGCCNRSEAQLRRLSAVRICPPSLRFRHLSGGPEPGDARLPLAGLPAPPAEQVMTVCSGSGLLARTGLLDGRRATTNKAYFAQCSGEGPGRRVGERGALGGRRRLCYVVGSFRRD